MNSAELRETLRQWLDELKWWSGETNQTWDDYILTDEEWCRYLYPGAKEWPGGAEFNPDRLHVVLWTSENEYHVSANGDVGYLAASVHARKNRPGENWRRENDLSDGHLSHETWNAILLGILRYEIKAASRDALDIIHNRVVATNGVPDSE